MAETVRPSQNGARPARRKPLKRTVYDISDMQVERDGIRIRGKVFALVGPADIGAEYLAEIMHLQALIEEHDQLQVGSVEAADVLDAHIAGLNAQEDAQLILILADVSRRMRVQHSAEQQEEHLEEKLRLLNLRTAAIFAGKMPKKVRKKLSMRQHEFLYRSFRQASSAGGQRPEKMLGALRAATFAT